MTKIRALRVAVPVLLVVVALVGGVVARRTIVGSSGRYRIGVSLPLSGAKQASGEAILAALRLHVDERNKAGGVGGRRLELVVKDDGNDPVAGERNARYLELN